MKLIHTSDWHLGKSSFEFSRLPDQEKFIFDFFLPLCDDEKPDAIMLCGDIFDRRVAPGKAILLFDSFIEEVCEKRGIKLLTITGNHDGGERFALASPLLRKQGFIVEARPEPEIAKAALPGADIYMLPYLDTATARDMFPEAEISNFSDAYKSVLSGISIKPDRSKLSILMAHCFIGGACVSDSENTLYVGGSGEVSAEIFADFDYAALGHLHTYQAVGGNLTYSGAPLKYSFSEENKDKYVVVLDISDNKISKREIVVTGQRNMRTVTGTFDEILANAADDPCRDDYIEAVYSGPPVFEPMARLREVYPNAASLRRAENAADSDENKRNDLRTSIKRGKIGEAEIFSEFLRQICGVEPTDEDLEIFLESAKSHVGGE